MNAPPVAQSPSLLAGIVCLLLLPFVIALGLHLGGWRPARTNNHGQLLNPPIALAVPGPWRGQWSLLLLHDAPCAAACRRRLDELRRLRLTLGRDMGQLRLVWLGSAISDEAIRLRAAIPEIVAVDGHLPAFSSLPAESLLLVDPQGRAMLRYPPGSPASDIRDDLQRLLKTSWPS